MKKTILFISLAFLILTLGGCKASNNTNTSSSSANAKTSYPKLPAKDGFRVLKSFEASGHIGETDIIVDVETGVEYIMSVHHETLTPRLGADGKPMVDSVK